jgi:hypothetical protein
MPGVGLHDVAMGDQRFAPIRAAEGIASIRTAQGILWLGRRALHVHRVVMDRASRGAGPNANVSTLFGQAADQCHIIAPLPRSNRRNHHAIQLGK